MADIKKHSRGNPLESLVAFASKLFHPLEDSRKEEEVWRLFRENFLGDKNENLRPVSYAFKPNLAVDSGRVIKALTNLGAERYNDGNFKVYHKDEGVNSSFELRWPPHSAGWIDSVKVSSSSNIVNLLSISFMRPSHQVHCNGKFLRRNADSLYSRIISSLKTY